MRIYFKPLLAISILGLFLVACSPGESPSLAVADQLPVTGN